MKALVTRLDKLERPYKPIEGQLPDVVPDDTPEADIEALRAGGREVYRMGEFVEHAI